MKKLKGFTLVEMIVCIALLAVIGISIGINMKMPKNKVSIESISDDIQTYYYLNKDKSSFKYYYTDSNETVTCIKVATLIKEGLVDENNLGELKKDDIVKVSQDENGLIKEYEIVTNDTSKCDYTTTKVDENVENGTIDINNNNDNANISQIVTKDETRENYYNSKLKFNAKLLLSVEKPLYVILVLDNSQSMTWNDTNRNAIKAIDNMIPQIFSINNSYIGFMTFNNKSRPYENTESGNYWYQTNNEDTLLSNVDNVVYYSTTYFDQAYNNIYDTYLKDLAKLNKKEVLYRYVIFLTDAEKDATRKITDGYPENVKNNSDKFITIAYSSGADAESLKTISSTNCEDTTNHICSYSSNSSNINTIFQNISTTIQQETSIKSATINIELSDYFALDETTIDKEVMSYDEKTKTIIVNSDFTNNNQSDFDLALNYSLIFLPENFKSTTTGVQNLYLIKKITINFTNKDGSNYSKDIENLPYITMNVEKESAIN